MASPDSSEDAYLARANSLLKEAPLIDGHNDLPFMIRAMFKNKITSPNFNIDDFPIAQTDLTRLSKGRLGAQFWSAFVWCPTESDDFSTPTLLPSLLETLQQIDLIHNLINKYPSHFALASCADDIMPIFRSGKVASLIGVEGFHQIANSVSVLRMFHKLGVRYVTLCHSSNTMWADSATSKTQPHDGLSEAGKSIIKEMNRIGMMVDLSHTSHATQRDVLSITEAPVIFSHSSCYDKTAHPRNAPDDVLRSLKQNDGIIMICFCPEFVSSSQEDPDSATLADVVDHILHAASVTSWDHVGIGSDFDGMPVGPDGLDSVDDYPDLVAELLRRGVDESDVAKVLGHNLIRVMKAIEAAGEKIREKGTDIMCDEEIKDVFTEDQQGMIAEFGEKRLKKAREKKTRSKA